MKSNSKDLRFTKSLISIKPFHPFVSRYQNFCWVGELEIWSRVNPAPNSRQSVLDTPNLALSLPFAFFGQLAQPFASMPVYVPGWRNNWFSQLALFQLTNSLAVTLSLDVTRLTLQLSRFKAVKSLVHYMYLWNHSWYEAESNEPGTPITEASVIPGVGW